MAIEKLRRMQFGLEASSAQGTPVSATGIWRGPAGMIADAVERTLVNENIGYMVQTDRGYFPRAYATLDMPETEATFEQIQHIFSAGLSTASASPNGGTTTAYVREFQASTTSVLPIATYTWETGDEQEQYRLEYGFVSKFGISGAPNQAVMHSGNWGGRQKTATDFTGSLSPIDVEEILFNRSKLYLDSSTGTLGATVQQNAFLGFTVDVITGWIPVFTGDGELYFSFLKNTGAEITGSITLEYNSVGEAAEDGFASGLTYLMRIDCIGSALSGTGGTFTTKLLRLDHAIQIASIEMGAQDGDNVITLNWKAVYNTTASLFNNYTVVNLIA